MQPHRRIFQLVLNGAHRHDKIKAFLSPFKTENNVSVSTAVNLEQGGYRVRITASGYDTTMTGWVFLDDMTLKLEKNNAGEVLFYRKTCESTNLQANAEAKNFRYFNPANGNILILNNSVKYTWSASPMPEGFKYSGAKIWIEGNDLPSVNTDYTVKATDNFEMWKEDAVKYITIIPKADFETEYEKSTRIKFRPPWRLLS
ncbi:MAG: hypothetical protein HC905_28570 [Bacteroidales bacterium]|nr:hypothetical protein [Bacteroidales bacterium]